MTKPLRVLFVEDSEEDTLILLREFERGGYEAEFHRVETLVEMAQALERQKWDVIIAEQHLPNFSAIAALELMKENRIESPFIVVSGSSGDDTAVTAIKAGAHDYILKENLGRMVAAVERELRDCEMRVARHRAEDALRESEARVRSLFEATFEGLVIHEYGTILDANPAFEKMFGYSHAELAGTSLMELAREDWREFFTLKILSADEQVFQVECSTREGRRLVVEVVGKKHNYQGRDVRVAAMWDVTERENVEAQLRQAQKMEAIGRLAGGIAHDFNNLLTIINGYSDVLLQRLTASDPKRRSIEQIQAAAERAASLTRQLLTFSRRQVVTPKVLNINTVLKECESLLRRLMIEPVELILLPGQEVGDIRVDPGQMEQVLLNLAVNACDAMPTGGRLTIQTANAIVTEEEARLHDDAAAGDFVVLVVRDTGVGMTDEVKTHLFEPFFSTKPKPLGTGLGLATCYGIVRQSGGFITVDSAPGEGSCFKIYMPRVAPAASSPVLDQHPGFLARGTETVLVVEDEDAVRELVVWVLTDLGYRVIEAANGRLGMQVVQDHGGRIDLVLTDVVMPQMGGKELADWMSVAYPDVKVLFMSGYPDRALSSKALPVVEPASALLYKPFNSVTLARTVRAVFDGRFCDLPGSKVEMVGH